MGSFKPDKRSFLFFYVLYATVFAVTAGSVLAYFQGVLPGVVVGAGVVCGALLRRSKQYDKERYSFEEDGLRVKTGTRFSSTNTLLPWENITSLHYTRGFVERVLFGTGNCSVDSAGSMASSVSLKHVDPGVISSLEERFDLRGDERRSIDANTLAAVGQGAWQAVTSLVGAALVVAFPQQGGSTGLVIGILAISLVSNGLAALRQIVDDVTLTYTSFDDRVTIQGGMFRKQSGLMLADHVSDTTTNQSFLERLLGVETLTVSVAGGERDINLPYVAQESSFDSSIPRRTEPSTEASSDKRDTGLQASPHVVRSIIGFIALALMVSPLLALFPALTLLLVIYGAQYVIRPLATTYTVDDDAVSKTFSFFQRRTTMYERDKVTGVVWKRNPLDWVFGTVTVELQSIGSAGRLTLSHIPLDDDLVDKVTRIQAVTTRQHRVRPASGLSTVIARFLPLVLVALAVIGGLAGRGYIWYAAGLTGIASGGLLIAWWRLKHASLVFGDDALSIRRGFVFKQSLTTSYAHVKRLSSCLYPFTPSGSLTVSVPGGGLVTTSWAWTMPCVRRPWKQHNVVDGCVKREGWSAPLDVAETIWSDQPSLIAVSLRVAAFVSVLTATVSLAALSEYVSMTVVGPVLIVVLGLGVGFFLYQSQSRFSRSTHRFIAEQGLLYRCASTVLHGNTDFSNVSQSWYDLLADTGTVSIYTTGSEEADIVFNSVGTYDGVYDDSPKNRPL